MTSLRRRCVLALGLLSVCGASLAQPADATLFHNVRIYDGRGASLSAPSDVLVRGERGLLVVSIDSLARMSSNPFFDFLMERVEQGIKTRPTPAKP